MINLVIGAAHRRQASLAAGAAGRRTALERAIECYTDMLKTDPHNERARAELASTRAEAAAAVPN
jgi:hypothetical protein